MEVGSGCIILSFDERWPPFTGIVSIRDFNFDDFGAKITQRLIDPGTGKVTEEFAGSDEVPFYTWRRGKHQVLSNGNLLLTESEHGRLLEVDAEGALVWERHMRWDDAMNVIVTATKSIPIWLTKSKRLG